MTISKILKSRVFRHLIFILLLFLTQILQERWIIDKERFVEIYWLFVLKDTLSDLIFFYTISYYIIPNITKTRLYPFLLFALFASYIFGYGSNYVMFRLIDDCNAYSRLSFVGSSTSYTLKTVALAYKSKEFFAGIFDGTIFFVNLTWYGSIVFFQVILKSLKDFYFLQIKNLNYQKELIRLELDFLKTQINPHFLFNTLNNVYSMIAYKDKLAADSILRLSDMMRYSLYETNKEKVPLSKEIEFIENYLSLERIRHGDYVKIEFELIGQYKNFPIVPFLLIILLENAFKHGLLPAPRYTQIDVKIIIEDSSITFLVVNPITDNSMNSQKIGGVGLTNLRRRLLLLYPNTHNLTITKSNVNYSARLVLDNLIENPIDAHEIEN